MLRSRMKNSSNVKDSLGKGDLSLDVTVLTYNKHFHNYAERGLITRGNSNDIGYATVDSPESLVSPIVASWH
jgi:hypothetical protein